MAPTSPASASAPAMAWPRRWAQQGIGRCVRRGRATARPASSVPQPPSPCCRPPSTRCRPWTSLAPAPTPTSLRVRAEAEGSRAAGPLPLLSSSTSPPAPPALAPLPALCPGMNWVMQHVQKNGWRAVVNMSLGGCAVAQGRVRYSGGWPAQHTPPAGPPCHCRPRSTALNDAAQQLINAGIPGGDQRWQQVWRRVRPSGQEGQGGEWTPAAGTAPSPAPWPAPTCRRVHAIARVQPPGHCGGVL